MHYLLEANDLPVWDLHCWRVSVPPAAPSLIVMSPSVVIGVSEAAAAGSHVCVGCSYPEQHRCCRFRCSGFSAKPNRGWSSKAKSIVTRRDHVRFCLTTERPDDDPLGAICSWSRAARPCSRFQVPLLSPGFPRREQRGTPAKRSCPGAEVSPTEPRLYLDAPSPFPQRAAAAQTRGDVHPNAIKTSRF